LTTAWIDYKKAFDSVPHDWILKCLSIYNPVPNNRYGPVENNPYAKAHRRGITIKAKSTSIAAYSKATFSLPSSSA